MKNLRNLCFVDNATYMRASNRDKSLINILCLFVPISAFIAGYSFYYGVYFVLDSVFLGIVVGILLFIGVLFHDKTLLDTFSKGKIIGRILFSILIALIMAIPYKVHLSSDTLTLKIQQEITELNNDVNAELLAEEQLIYEQEEKLMAKVTKASGTYDATGKTQQLTDARRELKSFQEKKDIILESLRQNFESKKKEADLSRISMAGYYLKNMFNTDSPAELFINLFVFVLLLCLESMPALIRLLLNDGDYIRIKEHLEKVAQKADENMWKLDKLLLTEGGLAHLPQILAEREVWKIMKDQGKKDFENSSELIALMNQAGMLPTASKEASNAAPIQNEEQHPNFSYQN